MRPRFRTLLLAAMLAAFLIPGHVQAAPSTVLGGPLPASMFPGGSNGILHRNAGPLGYTCIWAMDCQDDLPGEHSATADLLGRTGGWIQLEVWSATVGVSTGKRAHTVTDMEAFGFAVSSFVDGPTPDSDAYGSIPASTAAVADFQREQTQMHLVPVASPAAIPSGVQWLEKDQRPYVEVAAAFPIGNDDVEAIAVCQHCTAAQKHDMGTRFAAALMALWGRQ